MIRANKQRINNVVLVVRVLMDGRYYKAGEIAEIISKTNDRKVEPRYISQILSRISNPDISSLGFFINRRKISTGYAYALIPEACSIPEHKLYGLTLHKGKDCYLLEKALQEYPDLQKYANIVKAKVRNVPPKAKGDQSSDARGTDDDTSKIYTPEIIETSPDKGKFPGFRKQPAGRNADRTKKDTRPVTTLVPVLNPGIPVVEERIPGPDGTMIHYMCIGEGDLTIAACNGIGVSTFFWKFIVNYFSTRCRIILWDYRSHGKSDPAPDLQDLSMTNMARDLEAVLTHNQINQAVLIGHSMGTQVIFEFYRLFPDKVAALIPLLGTYGNALSTFLNTNKMIPVVKTMHHLAFAFPWLVNPVLRKLAYNPLSFLIAKISKLVNWQHCSYRELKPYLQHLGTIDMRAFFSLAVKMQEHSARDILTEIKAPTLIIAGENDLFTPLYVSDKMYKMIPDAEMMIIPCGSHAAIIEQPELINLRVEKFISEKLGWKANSGQDAVKQIDNVIDFEKKARLPLTGSR